MSRWASIVITAIVLVATAGVAWGVMSTRVDAAVVRLDEHHRRLQAVERRSIAMEWMMYRICEAVEAHPCVQPVER